MYDVSSILNNDYDKAAIRKAILLMMLPIMLENFLQLLTELVATAMVGRLTDVDISIQGMSTKIIDFVYYLFRGCGLALVVVISKNMAQEKIAESRTVFEKTVVSTIVVSFFIGTLLFLFPEVPTKVFTSDEALISGAANYIRILVFCLPFWGVNVCVSSVFQGKGDTKTPMIIAAFVNVLNIFLCYGLIFGNMAMPELGYKGAAVSLLVSRIAGCLVGILVLYNKKLGLFTWRGQRKKVEKVLYEIYSIGLPSAAESGVWQVASIFLSRILLFYGSSVFAAYQLGVQAEYITEIPAIGFSIVAISLVSRVVVLQNEKLYIELKKELIRICVILSIITSFLLMVFPHIFMRILTDNETLTGIAIPYVVIMGTIQIPQNLIKIYGGILRSANYKNIPLIVSIFGTWIVRLTSAYLCAYVFNLPLISIWFCILADQVIRCAILRYQVNHKKII